MYGWPRKPKHGFSLIMTAVSSLEGPAALSSGFHTCRLERRNAPNRDAWWLLSTSKISHIFMQKIVLLGVVGPRLWEKMLIFNDKWILNAVNYCSTKCCCVSWKGHGGFDIHRRMVCADAGGVGSWPPHTSLQFQETAGSLAAKILLDLKKKWPRK